VLSKKQSHCLCSLTFWFFIIGLILFWSSACSSSSLAPLEKQAKILKEGKKGITELLSEYQSMIDKNPKNPLPYVLAASVYWREESRHLYEKALAISPKYGLAHLGLARFFMRYDNSEKALEHYREALASIRKNKDIRHEALRAAIAASNLEEAEQMAEEDADLKREIVNILIDEGFIEEAGKRLSLYGFDQDEKPASVYLKGRMIYAKGEKDNKPELISQGLDILLDSWRMDPSPIYFYKLIFPRRPLTQLLSKARRTEDLKKVVIKGLEIYPKEFSLYPELWKITFAETKENYALARQSVSGEIEALLKKYPADPALYSAAIEGYKMVDAPEEVEKIQKALLEKFPYSLQAQIVRQALIYQEKDLTKRMELFAKFIQDFPNYPYAYQGYFKTAVELKISDEDLLKLAEAFLIKDKGDHSLQAVVEEFLKRKTYLDRVEKWLADSGKNPDLINNAWDVRILNLKARLLLFQGKEDEAELILNRLMNLEVAGLSNVDKGATKLYLAEVYEAKGDFGKALDLYAQAYAQSQHYLKEAGEKFQRLYRQKYGSEKGMEAFLSRHEQIYQSEEAVGTIGIERGTRLNEPAPDFELKATNGQTVRLSSFKGRVVILNFWATWCGPCNLELPHLQEFYDKHKERNDVALLTISTDENKALVEPFLRKKGFTFPVLYDDGLRAQFKVRGIPTTFIIDPSGRIRVRMVGFNPNEPLVPYLEKLVNEFRNQR